MLKFIMFIFVLISFTEAHATCFGEGGISHADIPESVLMSIVQVISTDDGGNILSRATGFIVAGSSWGQYSGLNRIMTVKHGILSSNIYLVSSEGSLLGRASVEADENDSVVLSMASDTEQYRYRQIPGITLGAQSYYTGVISSPSGTDRGASGAPLMDAQWNVRSILTSISLSGKRNVKITSGNIDNARNGMTGETDINLPSASSVRTNGIPISLMQVLGKDAFFTKSQGMKKGVLTMPALPSSQCIVHQGYFYRSL